MRFSIIIVSWNGASLLREFLPSVTRSLNPDAEVILADNASTDGTEKVLREDFPTVRHVVFEQNFGYCGGNNRAVSSARGEWLIFLNNDVRVSPNWLSALSAFIDKHPDIAILQPVIRSEREPEKFEYAGASGGFLDRYGYPFCRGRVFDTIETDRGQYANPEFISWASGAALVIRKSVFESLGGFPEAFEFHMEEIDLCWRAWRNGHKAAVCPESIVYHLGGGSLPMGSYRKLFYNFRNGLFMLVRNDINSGWAIRLFLRMLLDGAAAFQGLAKGNPVVLKAVFFAHMAFYRAIRTVLAQRKELKQHASANSAMPVLQSCLPVDYFLGKKRTFESLTHRISRTPFV